jgi:hypothetical protein
MAQLLLNMLLAAMLFSVLLFSGFSAGQFASSDMG